MAESKVYPAKSPVEIVQSILRQIDPLCCLYGPFMYHLFETDLKSQDSKELATQMSLQMARNRYTKFLAFLEAAGFLRASVSRTNTVMGQNCTQASLSLEINGTSVSLDVVAIPMSSNPKPWSDFTCNNIAIITHRTGGKALVLRMSDPDGKDEQFIGRCIQDIVKHRLVPMCPDIHLRVTEKSHPHIRQQCVKMIKQAMHLMAQGWTLEPSLTGKKLEFTPYVSTSPESCVICQEKMTSLAVTLLCGHSYHIDCLCRQMMESGPSSYKCGLCGKHILFSKPEPERPPLNATQVATSAARISRPEGDTRRSSQDNNSDGSVPTQVPPANTPIDSGEGRGLTYREWAEVTNNEIPVRGRHVVARSQQNDDNPLVSHDLCLDEHECGECRHGHSNLLDSDCDDSGDDSCDCSSDD
jgi:hypothetical protein